MAHEQSIHSSSLDQKGRATLTSCNNILLSAAMSLLPPFTCFEGPSMVSTYTLDPYFRKTSQAARQDTR